MAKLAINISSSIFLKMIDHELFHLLKTAAVDFKRNKARTLLTSLGIMIGVLSVVMLIALGLGLKNFIKQQFESLGSNLLMVMPGSSLSDETDLATYFRGMVGGIKFDEKDVTSLRRVPNLDYVVPIFYKSTIVKTETEEELGYIFGTNEEIFQVLNLESEAGEIFTKANAGRRSKNVILGAEIARKLFTQSQAAVGKTIRLDDQRFKVTGVVKKKSDPEIDAGIYMPYKTTYGSLNPDKTFFTIYLGVSSETAVPQAKKNVEEVLAKRYEEDEFSVSEQTEILGAINTIFNMINGVLIAIGSISLLVGGIGIMNIMYATVNERTKEVGIRRAVGATQRDILLQFLTESVILSILGGTAGLLLAALIVIIVHPFFPVSINFLAVFLAFTISSAIGIFFGVFPARRAAKLSPIEAIRYE